MPVFEFLHGEKIPLWLLQELDAIWRKLSGLDFPSIVFVSLHELLSCGFNSISSNCEHGSLILCSADVLSHLGTMCFDYLFVEILWET